MDAARLIGCAAVAAIGQFAVDVPRGYFGPVDRMTRFGAVFLIAVTACAVAGAGLRLADRRLWAAPALLQIAIVLAAFVPPLAVDPVVAASVIVWHLAIFGRLTVTGAPGGVAAPRSPFELREPGTVWHVRNGAAVAHLLIVSLVVTVAAIGYRLGSRTAVRGIVLGLGVSVIALAGPFLLARIRERSIGAVAVGVLIAAAAVSARRPEIALSVLALAQGVVLVMVWRRSRVFGDLIESFYRRPAHLVAVSFLLLIAVGTLFLSFPAASAGPRPVAPMDALFTATSAACVTGLIVLDTPKDFSAFGLWVILALIQVGGLNIMVLSAFAAVLLGRGLGLRGEGAVGDVLDVQPGRSVRRMVVFIVVGTLVIELTGGGALAAEYARQGYPIPLASWYGLFHAVSAFCNAGFSLHSDSLVGFRAAPILLTEVAILVTLGGFGFGVLNALLTWRARRRSGGLAIQTRIVLVASTVLVLSGAAGYATLEWNGALGGLSDSQRVVNALFQSVTLRTAGFNSVPLDATRPATALGMMAWMFVGASPGGTGGGIKTTTVVVLLGTVAALVTRRNRIVIFRRRLSLATVYRSAAIAVVAATVVAGGAFALLATQDQPFEVLLFETFSAFGTVGLSLGATPGLDAVGKTIVIVLMLAGRVGPLTLALLLGRETRSRVGFPEARIMVG